MEYQSPIILIILNLPQKQSENFTAQTLEPNGKEFIASSVLYQFVSSKPLYIWPLEMINIWDCSLQTLLLMFLERIRLILVLSTC